MSEKNNFIITRLIKNNLIDLLQYIGKYLCLLR